MPINTPTGYLDITNATLRGSKIVTTGFVGIANANPTNHLSIGSNLHINDTHSNVLQISGNINAASVVLGGISIAPTFDLEIVTNTGNTTPYTVEFNNTATAFVTTANATIGDTLTASKLVGDGSGISAIQSSNVSDFGSNVSRITTLETDLGNNSARITNLSSNLSDNSARITNLSSNLSDNSARITNLSSNLSDNSSRITALESGDISISGDKTFTGDIIFESNVHMNGGNVFVANTVNLTVSDPIIELGSNNIGANDLGIIMTRPNNNSNVAVVFDESVDILRMGYTLNGANDSIVDLDSNALAVSVQGALSAASVSGDGSGLTSLNASNITTGALSTTSVTIDDYLIHDGDTDTKVGFPLADTFTVTTANSERLRVDSSGNVGIGTDSPAYTLDVHGTANVGALYSTLTYSNASANIVAWNSSTNEIIDSGLEKGFTEHPLVPMTDYNTYVEGHGTYEASASSYTEAQQLPEPWRAFDNNYVTGAWRTSGFSNSTYLYQGPDVFVDVGGTRYNGPSLTIKMPYSIVLSHSTFRVWNTTFGINTSPKVGYIFGSNNGIDWYKIFYTSDFGFEDVEGGNIKTVSINATTPYTHYAFVCTQKNNSGTETTMNLNEWRLFAEKDVTKMENLHISGDLSSETLQTGYIKWPKVPLKANESEGYVVDASSANSGFTRIYSVFNDLFIGQSTEYWDSASTYSTSTGAHNNTVSTTDAGGVVHYGEWVQIKLTNAIALHSMKWYPRIFYSSGTTYATWPLERVPKSGVIMGSNDGITWRTLRDFADISYTTAAYVEGTEVKVISSTPYVYYRLVITSLNAGTGSNRAGIMELQLFEAATGVGAAPTSAKLQVAGSLGMAKGSEFFAGDDVVMELPKHDRPLTMYPEIKMTANSFAGYVASASSYYSNSNYPPYEAFDRVYGTELNMWISRNYVYLSNGNPDTANVATFQGVHGEYLSLSMPNKIKLEKIRVHSRNNSVIPNAPHKGRIYGSNDNSNWTQIGTYDGLSMIHNDYKTITVNASEYYKDYTFLVEQISPDFTLFGYVNIAELEYYGYEEGDTSVDVVHRSVPNKPGQQQLSVWIDPGNKDSYSLGDNSKTYDLVDGRAGNLYGDKVFDPEFNSWYLDGSGDDIDGTITTTTGAWVHSISCWVKNDTVNYSSGELFTFGPANGSQMVGLRFNGTDKIRSYFYSNDVLYHVKNNSNRWLHVVFTYDGGSTIASRKLYVNGEECLVESTSGVGALNLQSTSYTYYVSRASWSSVQQKLKGYHGGLRVYNKVLSHEQVLELYDYEAARFGHRQNLVSLHKGNLGIGVNYPNSRLEVAGADGLQEYPPRGITLPGVSYNGTRLEEYIERHGLFVVDGTSNYTGGGTDDRRSWNMFEKLNAVFHANGSYATTGTPAAIDVTTTLANNSANLNFYTQLRSGGTIFADWVQLELPYKILLKQNSIKNHNLLQRSAAKGYIVASNDGFTFDVLNTIDDFGYTTTYQEKTFITNTNTYYRIYRLLFTHKVGGDGNAAFNMSEWRLFGTPAPSSLEDGHLTLGKALTAPRVSGHAAGAETPRAESLVVHYDTTVDSVASGTSVVDTSGSGNNGTFNNNTTYSSSDRALVFDGTDDYIKVNDTGVSGDYVHSISFWIYNNNHAANPFWIGENIDGKRINIYLPTTRIDYSFRGDTVSTTSLPPINRWWHLAVTYNGTQGITGRKIYIDGVAQTTVHAGTPAALNITDGVMYLGTNFQQGSDLDGKMSKVKIWNVALTADEVAMEYALGRTGKSLNLTDTSLCLGGTVPRAQLDVRGSMIIDGIIKHSAWPAFRVTTNNGENVFSNHSGGTNAKSSGHNNNTNSADEVIPWKNVVYDNTGSYTYSGAGDYKFTAPVSGIYNFHFHCLFTRGSTSSSRLDLKFFVNGGLNAHLEMNDDFSSSTNANVGRGHTTNVHLNAGNFVQAVFTGVGGTWGVYSGGAQYFNVFSGQLIAAD